MQPLFKGIDVSRWQGNIDWAKVKSAGMDFVMVRAGYCGYAGDVSKDVKFEANMAGATAADLDVGVYLYSYATTPAAAKVAAGQLLELVKGYTLNYPVAFDIEDPTNVAKSKAENTAITQAFLSTVEAAGYLPVLYTYKSFAEAELNMNQLTQYDFWLAHVAAQTNYTGPYTIWQYSWTGSVPGISGDVDLNYCFKDYPAYIAENGLNGQTAGGGTEDGDDNEDTSAGDTDGGDGSEGVTTTPDESAGFSYVVVKNDTLSHIAQRYALPLRVLVQANPQIKNPDRIYVGQIIYIPEKPGNQ